MKDWQPTASISTLQKRARILQSIRAFFIERGLLEVDTPMLSQAALTDPSIESFAVTHKQNTQGYLHTSPEFPMKRLLASGSGDIFQLCHVFRAEEQSKKHNSEFMMLEWYRLNWSMQALMQEVAELIQSIFANYSQVAPSLPVSYITYQALFQKHLGFDPLLITVDELKAIVRSGLPVEIIVSDAQWLEYDKDDWLNWLLGNYIEPKLGQDELCFVVDYPVSQASLAKQSLQDARVAKRFECYYQGIELCNGFEELTDSTEQRQRFQQENAQRAAMGLAEMPIDERLLAALPNMPPCSGVAVGIDRVIMLALGLPELAEVMAFTSYNA